MADRTRQLKASELESFLRRAGVLTQELDACKGSRSRAIKIGQFLSAKVGTPVPVEFNGRTGMATFRLDTKRAREKVYFAEVTWDDEPNAEGDDRKRSDPDPVGDRHRDKSPRPATSTSAKGPNSRRAISRDQEQSGDEPPTGRGKKRASTGRQTAPKKGRRPPRTPPGGNLEDW